LNGEFLSVQYIYKTFLQNMGRPYEYFSQDLNVTISEGHGCTGWFRVKVSFSEHAVTAHCNSPRRKKFVETKVVEYREANNFPYSTLTPGDL